MTRVCSPPDRDNCEEFFNGEVDLETGRIWATGVWKYKANWVWKWNRLGSICSCWDSSLKHWATQCRCCDIPAGIASNMAARIDPMGYLITVVVNPNKAAKCLWIPSEPECPVRSLPAARFGDFAGFLLGELQITPSIPKVLGVSLSLSVHLSRAAFKRLLWCSCCGS